ncbi:MAG: 50S ribosomal protein L32 [Nitrospirae bacterium]|nr:50S ribosomal protein L32 [Nitrospirota bacterium]
MANPKHKISRARRDSRRAHHAMVAPTLTTCPQCREPKLPHRVCPSCGVYRGRNVIAVKEV